MFPFIVASNGFILTDCGRKVFLARISLSLGVIRAEPGWFGSHHQIATAAFEAKKQTKKIPGNSLFIERRQGPASRMWPYTS